MNNIELEDLAAFTVSSRTLFTEVVVSENRETSQDSVHNENNGQRKYKWFLPETIIVINLDCSSLHCKKILFNYKIFFT